MPQRHCKAEKWSFRGGSENYESDRTFLSEASGKATAKLQGREDSGPDGTVRILKGSHYAMYSFTHFET